VRLTEETVAMSETPDPCPSTDTTQPTCSPLVAPDPPKLPDPVTCPQPCCCPPPPGGDGGSCLTSMIIEQSQVAEQAAMAKDFADELRALQDKGVAARANYTRAKFEALTTTWVEQDAKIAAITTEVACSVKCWKCLLECRLCTLLYDIRALERQLNGTGVFATQVDTLRELANWHERNRNERQAYFDRVKDALSAWEDPAKALEGVLDANKALIDGMRALLASDPAGAVYALFVKLIPAHWAIRPRGTGAPASTIDAAFIDICDCDPGDPDDCCGPDTGLRSVRHRLLPPLPYLVDPEAFFGIICCLVKERYLPAKNLLAEAHAKFETARQDVERTEAQIKARTDSLEADFKAELSSPIDCSQYWKKRGPDDPCTTKPEPQTPRQEPPKPESPKQESPQPSGA
jgi:hypothetical protein